VGRACGVRAVRKFGEQFGELASDVLIGANVRSGAQMCGERAAEIVRTRSKREYPSELVRYSIRYGPHGTRNDRARPRPPLAAPAGRPLGPSNVAHRAPNQPSRHPSFDRPLQAAAAERVRHNTIQDKS